MTSAWLAKSNFGVTDLQNVKEWQAGGSESGRMKPGDSVVFFNDAKKEVVGVARIGDKATGTTGAIEIQPTEKLSTPIPLDRVQSVLHGSTGGTIASISDSDWRNLLKLIKQHNRGGQNRGGQNRGGRNRVNYDEDEQSEDDFQEEAGGGSRRGGGGQRGRGGGRGRGIKSERDMEERGLYRDERGRFRSRSRSPGRGERGGEGGRSRRTKNPGVGRGVGGGIKSERDMEERGLYRDERGRFRSRSRSPGRGGGGDKGRSRRQRGGGAEVMRDNDVRGRRGGPMRESSGQFASKSEMMDFVEEDDDDELPHDDEEYSDDDAREDESAMEPEDMEEEFSAADDDEDELDLDVERVSGKRQIRVPNRDFNPQGGLERHTNRPSGGSSRDKSQRARQLPRESSGQFTSSRSGRQGGRSGRQGGRSGRNERRGQGQGSEGRSRAARERPRDSQGHFLPSR